MKKSIILLISIFCVGCISQTNKSKNNISYKLEKNNNSTCEIQSLDDDLKSIVFPFSFLNFNSQKIIKHFSDGTTIDSLTFFKDGNEYSIYKFRYKSSYLSLFTKPNSDWFYLDSCSLKNDLMKSKIYIGMSQNDFFNATRIDNSKCDTIDFFLGETIMYYRFTFEKKKLKEATIYSTI